jgi:hypothetical protein
MLEEGGRRGSPPLLTPKLTFPKTPDCLGHLQAPLDEVCRMIPEGIAHSGLHNLALAVESHIAPKPE